jgi:hypothetical protein
VIPAGRERLSVKAEPGEVADPMKKMLTVLVAVTALVVPAAASAHHGHGWHHRSLLASVSGTGASFTNSSAAVSGSIAKSEKLGTGTFAATVTTDWTKATTRTGTKGTLACAPASTALTLTGTTAANTLHATLTGKTCKWTPTGGTTTSAFFGRGTATGAGALANLTGKTAKAWLMQKSDGSVKGAVFAGVREERSLSLFTMGERHAAHEAGDCDHRH